MKDIVLFGGGGHCYAAVELIRSLNEFAPSIIYDDNPKEDKILGIPVKKYQNEVVNGQYLCLTIGDNGSRKNKAIALKEANFPSFIHESCVVYPSSTIGKGTLGLPNAVIDADCSIGDFCIINNNATVSHNVILKNFVHVAINVAIAGGVTIGEGTLVGAGSIILPNIKIGNNVIIGAGSVVTKDVSDDSVIYGNPAKIRLSE